MKKKITNLSVVIEYNFTVNFDLFLQNSLCRRYFRFDFIISLVVIILQNIKLRIYIYIYIKI